MDKLAPYIYVEFKEESSKSRAVLSHKAIVKDDSSSWDSMLFPKNVVSVFWKEKLRGKAAKSNSKTEFLAEILLVGNSRPELACQMGTDLKYPNLKSGEVRLVSASKRATASRSNEAAECLDEIGIVPAAQTKNEMNAKIRETKKRKADVINNNNSVKLKKALNEASVFESGSEGESPGQEEDSDASALSHLLKAREKAQISDQSANDQLKLKNRCEELTAKIDETEKKLLAVEKDNQAILRGMREENKVLSELNLSLEADVQIANSEAAKLKEKLEESQIEFTLLNSDFHSLQSELDEVKQMQEGDERDIVIQSACRICIANGPKVESLKLQLETAIEMANSFMSLKLVDNVDIDLINKTEEDDKKEVSQGTNSEPKKRSVNAFVGKTDEPEEMTRAVFEEKSVYLANNLDKQLKFPLFDNLNDKLTLFNNSAIGFMWEKDVCRRQNTPTLTAHCSDAMRFRDILISMLDKEQLKYISYTGEKSSVGNLVLAPLHPGLKEAVGEFLGVDPTKYKVNYLVPRVLCDEKKCVKITDL